MTIPTDIAYALELDAQDKLAHFRERFIITDPTLIYMDGNSLGRLPKATLPLAENLLQHQWGDRLIRSWNEGWFTAPERVGAKIAHLIGAYPDEATIADLHRLIFSSCLSAHCDISRAEHRSLPITSTSL